MKKNKLPLESLACVNDACKAYGQKGQDNLRIRKVYGRDEIRYLRCSCCGKEFSERKGTALWNCKLPEAKAIGIAEQLAEGTSYQGTARLLRVTLGAVQRLAGCLGNHAQSFHDERVRNLPSTALQADERWGYAGSKKQPQWEAEVIDPHSRLGVERALGKRDETLLEKVLQGAAARVAYPQGVVVFSDGEHSYKTLFPEVFGTPYQPQRKGGRGRHPKVRYRIGRRQAHVQIVKRHRGRRLVEVLVELTHGSNKRLERELHRLGYRQANPSTIELRNGTARRMDAFSVGKSLAFARRPESRDAKGAWAMTVYKRKYEKRSPAMAAGLTDFIWSVEAILHYQPFPRNC